MPGKPALYECTGLPSPLPSGASEGERRGLRGLSSALGALLRGSFTADPPVHIVLFTAEPAEPSNPGGDKKGKRRSLG